MAQKPLPAVPRHSNTQSLTTLSTDALSHLSDFVRHILSDADDDYFPGGTKEAWGRALELGLVELGNSISRGDWLTGLLRARKVQKARRDTERQDAEREKSRAKKEHEDLGKGKAKRKGIQATAQNMEEAPERNDTEGRGFLTGARSLHHADTTLAHRQVQELISRPSLPAPKSTVKHLMLSVAPFGSRIAMTAEGRELGVSPYGLACVFTSGVFSLPEAGSNESDGNVVLYGLDEWDGASSTILSNFVSNIVPLCSGWS